MSVLILLIFTQLDIHYSNPDEDELTREERETPVRVAVSGVAAASHTIIMEDHEEEEKGEGHNTELLAIPVASVTNSSSAETLTDNTLTEPETRLGATQLQSREISNKLFD